MRRPPAGQGRDPGQHGLINWADDDKACYELTLDLIERAARYIEAARQGRRRPSAAQKYQVAGRGAAARGLRRDPALAARAGQPAASASSAPCRTTPRSCASSTATTPPRLAELGTSCPDHFLRTKIKPLYVDWNPQTEDVDALQAEARAPGWSSTARTTPPTTSSASTPNSPAMRDPNPTVILIPGLGMIAWGKDKSESRVTAEFYNCAVEVMRGAEAIDEYTALPLQEAFDIEYWLLEEAKLQRMPPEKELARQVIAVVGAGSGIGREVALRLAKEGAHIVCVDRDAGGRAGHGRRRSPRSTAWASAWPAAASRTAARRSACAPTSPSAPASARCSTRWRWPMAASTRWRSRPASSCRRTPTGRIPDDKWALHLRDQRDRAYLVADEAAQRLAGAGAAGQPGADHLASTRWWPRRAAWPTTPARRRPTTWCASWPSSWRPLVRVNGVAPATVVQGSAMFPRDRVIASLAKYGIAYTEDEPTEALREQAGRPRQTGGEKGAEVKGRGGERERERGRQHEVKKKTTKKREREREREK